MPVIYARTFAPQVTDEQAEAADETTPVRIIFGFDMTDGELKTITATDEQGRNLLVSLKLTHPDTDTLCCCTDATTGITRCLKQAQCNCDPP